jgi:hypothetical protein
VMGGQGHPAEWWNRRPDTPRAGDPVLLFVLASMVLAWWAGPDLRVIAKLPVLALVIATGAVARSGQTIPQPILLGGVAWALALNLLPGLWRPIDTVAGALAASAALALLPRSQRRVAGPSGAWLAVGVGGTLGPTVGAVALLATGLLASATARSNGIQGGGSGRFTDCLVITTTVALVFG